MLAGLGRDSASRRDGGVGRGGDGKQKRGMEKSRGGRIAGTGVAPPAKSFEKERCVGLGARKYQNIGYKIVYHRTNVTLLFSVDFQDYINM